MQPTYTPRPTVVDPGLAYGTPCEPPCWWGMVPGQSTHEDADQAKEQIRDSGWGHCIGGSDLGFGVMPSPWPCDQAPDILVTCDDDVIDAIRGPIGFYYPVGTLVEKFGSPERLYHEAPGATICSSCEEGKRLEPPSEIVPSSSVGLFYPSQGLLFWMLVPDLESGCICPEMKVTAFCYYAPISMQQALTDDCLLKLCSSPRREITENDLIEWHGFGGGY